MAARKKELNAEWYRRNREQRLADVAAYQKANPDKVNATAAKYIAARRRATPAWADRQAIDAFYAGCPPGMAVDHIVPLQGELVCGFHVEYNLQYLTRVENASKHNLL